MQNNEQIKKIIKGQEQAITKIGLRKFTKLFIQLYSELCIYCRLRVQRNPKMNIDHYCPACKPKAQEVFKQLEEKLK